MTAIKNILFIMADQLRWDYLSCYGHPHLDTPELFRSQGDFGEFAKPLYQWFR